MNWLRHLNPFYRPPESEVLEAEMRKHAREAEGAQSQIRAHRFNLHMANATMDALEDWRHQRNLKDGAGRL